VKGKVLLGIGLAFLLWFITFYLKPANFWFLMGFSTFLLLIFVFVSDKKIFFKLKPGPKSFFYGLLSAILLYSVFYIGNLFLKYIATFNLLKNRKIFIENIYANKGNFSPIFISLLIIFPIAFGEEIFWRGFLQKNLSNIIGKWKALFVTVFFYSMVHVFSLNPILMLAALVCGGFWGVLYLYTKDIKIVLISHIIWDLIIFVIFPIL